MNIVQYNDILLIPYHIRGFIIRVLFILQLQLETFGGTALIGISYVDYEALYCSVFICYVF